LDGDLRTAGHITELDWHSHGANCRTGGQKRHCPDHAGQAQRGELKAKIRVEKAVQTSFDSYPGWTEQPIECRGKFIRFRNALDFASMHQGHFSTLF
jgi:hypothetical protein